VVDARRNRADFSGWRQSRAWENIDAFGGDPSRVLIFGYSAAASMSAACCSVPRPRPVPDRAALRAAPADRVNALSLQLIEAGVYDGVDRQISQEMQHTFVEFAKTDVPKRLDGRVWPTFHRADPQYTHAGDTVSFEPYRPEPLLSAIYSLREPGYA
jgi:carboxylesterase type B